MSEDRLVMYIVIPRKLKLSIGKVGATCGHAVQLLTEVREQWINRGRLVISGTLPWEAAEDGLLETWRAWCQTDYGKIVLGASEEEFAEVRKLVDGDVGAADPRIAGVTVVDIGLKEVAPGSVTAVGLWPMKKSAAPDLIKKLEPLR